MPKVRILVAAASLLLVAGCSSGSTSSAPSVAPTSPVSEPSTAAPTPAACPDGAYVVTALEGRGQASAVGKGTGGNIAAEFRSGTFRLSSDGSKPVTLDIGPTKAEMRFDGTITGTYEGDPSALRLALTGSDGKVGVKGFGVSREYAASGLADELVGEGATAQVTCDDSAGTALVVLPNASLTLTRQ